MYRRNGLSLIEIVVVIAIMAILIGLLLPAVQRARDVAIRLRSINNIKQINLATQHFASDQDGRVPAYTKGIGSPNPTMSLFSALLPLLEQGNLYRQIVQTSSTGPSNYYVPQYVSPADPTLREEDKRGGPASYAANPWAFEPGMTMVASYRDGTSNTLAFAEHYTRCGAGPQHIQYMYPWFGMAIGTLRPATFADPDYGDPYPITSGNPPTARASHPIQPAIPTFQVAPRPDDCNPRVAQTPHLGGMLVGLMDGSVRTLSPGISPPTYWGSITPAGGEVLTDW